MALILQFWRRYFLFWGLFIALALVFAFFQTWSSATRFEPGQFTVRDDPSARFTIESCMIGPHELSFSGWLVSKHWPAPDATLLLTSGQGKDEVSVPYRLRDRPDIAARTQTENNPFHNRYGFSAITRMRNTTGTANILHLNILVGDTLFRTRYDCRS